MPGWAGGALAIRNRPVVAVWAHPDLLPTTDDLVDPTAYLGRDELDVSALDESGPDAASEGQ